MTDSSPHGSDEHIREESHDEVEHNLDDPQGQHSDHDSDDDDQHSADTISDVQAEDGVKAAASPVSNNIDDDDDEEEEVRRANYANKDEAFENEEEIVNTASPVVAKRVITSRDDSDDDTSLDGNSPIITRRVVIDNEDDEEEVEDTPQSSKANTSLLNKDDFGDGDSSAASNRGAGSDNEDVPKKPKRILGSDSDDDDTDVAKKGGEPGDVDKIMSNIFGDESSDEDEADRKVEEQDQRPIDSDDADAKFLRVEGDSDDQGREWDFDVMLRKKKAERKRKYKRKGDSILLISDSDDLVKSLVDQMAEAAAEDRISNQDKRPAIQKRKMLQVVRSTLLKADLFETLLDNGMMSGISEWLAPLPDKSLPALEIRTTLLKILEGYPSLDQSILKQSGLGRAVMFLFKHPKETKENKMIAAKLIREWSRPIFQLDTDFRSLSRDERVQRDYAHMPVAKRRKLNIDADGTVIALPKSRAKLDTSSTADDSMMDRELRPGQAGFINRARVPKPSTRDYVIRPRPTVEGRFQGASKNRQTYRFDKAQRDFKERNKAQKVKRAVGVSLQGNKMDI